MLQVLILHGWGRGAKSFDRVKELLAEKGHEVVCFDLPGFGDAESPKEPWDIDKYVDFVSGKINSRGSKKFYLLGHSFGGQIGVKFAFKYPEKLNGLILYSASALRPRRTLKQLFFLSAAKTGNLIFSAPLLRYGKKFMTKLIYKLGGSNDYLNASPVMKETMRLVIAEDLKKYLSDISVPALIIWGDRDKMTPVSDAYIINKEIKGSRLEILENEGHSPHLKSPEKIAELVDKFIQARR